MKKKIVIYLDDCKEMPTYYKNAPLVDKACLCKSVNNAIDKIKYYESCGYEIFILDLDHDLGDYANCGGDGIKLIHWLIETGRNTENYIVYLHTMNPVGRENMQALIDRYW